MDRYILKNNGSDKNMKQNLLNKAVSRGGRYYDDRNANRAKAMKTILRDGIEPTKNRKNGNTNKTPPYPGEAGMKHVNGELPYVYPCPIQGNALMMHQESAAILSTRLGNLDNASNPTKREDGYVPRSLLLNHSAGSGKTLTMWRIFFWWCIRWWAPRPAYSVMVNNISRKANANINQPKNLPNIVIFISQSQEVDNMGTNELQKFEDIMMSQARKSDVEKYKNIVKDSFINALPPKKLVIEFRRSKEDDVRELHQKWKRPSPKDAHIVYKTSEKTSPDYYVSSGRQNRHPMLTSAFPTLGECMKGKGTTGLEFGTKRTFPNIGFKNNSAIPMFDLWLKLKSYIYMCLLSSKPERNSTTARGAYQLANKIVPPSIAKGAYYEFIRLFTIQNYAKQLAANNQAAVATKAGLAQEQHDVEYYTCPWQDKDEVTLNDVKVNDFVRFQVMGTVKDLSVRFDSDFHKAAGWNKESETYGDDFNNFCDRNIGGVSPLFFVKRVKKRDGKIELGLQHMLIHKHISDKMGPCYPIDQNGFVKPGFRLYDIYRFNRPITSCTEKRLDDVTMSESQQTCSASVLMRMLQLAGAEIKPDPKTKAENVWYPTRTSMSANSKMQMWWLAAGGQDEVQGFDSMDSYWEWIGAKMGAKSYFQTPKLPKTLFIGMSAEFAVCVFKRLPSNVMIMVDEVQKYSGDQGGDVVPIKNNPFYPKEKDVNVRLGMKCLLSAAMSSSQNGNSRNSNNSNYCKGYSSSPGDCLGVFASATPFVVDLSNVRPNEKRVNELQELIRMIGTSKTASIPEFVPTMVNKPSSTLNKYRNVMEEVLYKSKLLISFIDLDRDPLVIPTLTKRIDSKSGKGSVVHVWNVNPKELKGRLLKRDGGTSDPTKEGAIEERIGYFKPDGNKATQVQTSTKSNKVKQRTSGKTAREASSADIALTFAKMFR